MNESTDFQILTSSRSWRATPWDYSSLRFLRFNDDASAEFCYGYGQTIYAIIKCQFELTPEKNLRLSYLESPARGHFQGFVPTDANQAKDIRYQLTQENVTGVESIVAREYKFQWKLTLEKSPFPEEIQFPYDVPLQYYGHEEQTEEQNAEARK